MSQTEDHHSDWGYISTLLHIEEKTRGHPQLALLRQAVLDELTAVNEGLRPEGEEAQPSEAQVIESPVGEQESEEEGALDPNVSFRPPKGAA